MLEAKRKMIKSIDLWTEQYTDHHECFKGAFIDGFENNNIPFDEYKIIKNCNCLISCSNNDIHIRNKHNAIIFYDNHNPVRLMVINKNTDIEKCISVALNQDFNGKKLLDLYETKKIKSYIVDLKEESLFTRSDAEEEIDVASCDRWSLLYNMLDGSYTEDNISFGNYENNRYEFIPNLKIVYNLKTNSEEFEIEHKYAFINETKTRIIPIQANSELIKDNEDRIKFIKITNDNLELACKIQNTIFPEEDARENFIEQIKKDPYRKEMDYYIVYRDIIPVGVTGIYSYNEYPNDAWLGWFGILEAFRQKGYGGIVLDKTIELAREKGYKDFRLYTDEYAKSAHKLYESRGMIRELYDNKDDKDEYFIADIFIYSVSLTNEPISLWNNKMLGLKEQGEKENLYK